MAHIVVEYSANLDRVDDRCPALLARLSAAAAATGLLPGPGLRARAHRSDFFQVADGSSDGAFVHVQIRIGPGRAPAEQQRIADGIFAALKEFFAADSAARALALSLELVVLGVRHNHNNLREYLSAAPAQS